MPELWETDPTKTCVRDVGRAEAIRYQNLRLRFAKKVLPYMLKKTMFHNIAPVNFSKSSCKALILKRNCPQQGYLEGIRLESLGDINEWMGDWAGWEEGGSISSKGRFRKCGTAVMNRGFMTLFYEPSSTGILRMGTFDIDLGKGRTEKESRPIIVDIAKKLKKMGLVPLVMFTGKSWQVLFKRADNMPMGNYQEVRDEIIFPVARRVKGLTISKKVKRAPDGTIAVDYSVNAKRRLLRFFFSQHCSPGGKTHTGLVAIPVRSKEVTKFKIKTAHPVNVEKRLKEYMKMIDDFLPFGYGVERVAEKHIPKAKKGLSRKFKLMRKIRRKFGYSFADTKEAMGEFHKDIRGGESKLSDYEDEVQELLLLKYPGLEKRRKRAIKAVKIKKRRPVRIKTLNKEHDAQRLADKWKYWRGNWPDFIYQDALKFYKNKKDIVVSVKADGELECLHYRKNGVRLMGFDTKTRQSMRGKKVKCLMANHGSHIYINNPITEEFTRFCEENDIEEMIVFGEAFGMLKGKQLPFPPRIPGTSTSILASEDWNAWKKYMRFWAFDLFSIDGKEYFPKVKYKNRIKKLREMFGMEGKNKAQAMVYESNGDGTEMRRENVLKDIAERLREGRKVIWDKSKSAETIIEDSQKRLWNGYEILYCRPKDYLMIFKEIAKVICGVPGYVKERFGFNNIMLVKEGQYHMIVPVPISSKLRIKRLRKYTPVKYNPFIYGKKKIVKKLLKEVQSFKRLKDRKMILKSSEEKEVWQIISKSKKKKVKKAQKKTEGGK